jgi:hypothetical protein
MTDSSDEMPDVPSSRQFQAARFMLDLTQIEAARMAKIAVASVKRLEFDYRNYELTTKMRLSSLTKLKALYESMGIVFHMNEDGTRRGVSYDTTRPFGGHRTKKNGAGTYKKKT